MRGSLILFSLLLLQGCQSDFDKCMETEAPRAEKAMDLSQLASNLTRFRDASTGLVLANEVILKFQEFDGVIERPESIPDYPEYPDFACTDATADDWDECWAEHEKKKENYEKQKAQHRVDLEIWKLTPEGLSWTEQWERAYVNTWNEFGVLGTSREEIDGWFNDNYSEDELNFVREEFKNYANDFNCWGKDVDDCYDPIGAKVESESKLEYGDDGYEEKYVAAMRGVVASIIEKMTRAYSENTIRAELAILACNQHGFYE